MASDEDREEIAALVVGFLTQSLKENPEGFSLRDFERFFPEKTDEPADWYKRYNKRNTQEALELIKGDVEICYNPRRGTNYIKLNSRSKKIDRDLVDLVINQRSSGKKRSRTARPSDRTRAMKSFQLNQQYRGSAIYNAPTRINHDQHRGASQIARGPPLSRNTLNRSAASSRHDPRLRTMVPPQVRPNSSLPIQSHLSASRPPTSAPTQSSGVPTPATASPATNSATTRPFDSHSRHSSTPSRGEKVPKLSSNGHTSAPKPSNEPNPALKQKKSYFRQRLQSLLFRRMDAIKILNLNAIYQNQFDEKLDPTEYGHKDLLTLLQDPEVSDYIQLNFDPPLMSISSKNWVIPNDKENNMTKSTTKSTDARGSGLADKSNTSILSARQKLQAAAPFNLVSMLQSLEPLGPTKEPPLKPREVESVIKYRTLRLIYRSESSSLKLDEWETKFEEESRLRLRIWDYGFKNNLEFFKYLAKDLPIKVHLNKSDEWIAMTDVESLTKWVRDRLHKFDWKAPYVIDKRYELFSLPTDTYNFNESDSLIGKEYDKSIILSTKPSCSMWIRLKNKETEDASNGIMSSLTSYEDHKNDGIFRIPKEFIKPGLPCAAYDSNVQGGVWCRALILKTPGVIDKNYEIPTLLVDYGIERKFLISELLFLLKCHLQPTVRPIYSKLHGLKNESSLEVQKQFKKVVQEYTNPPVTLSCKFISKKPAELDSFLPRSRLEVVLCEAFNVRKGSLADHINQYANVKEPNE